MRKFPAKLEKLWYNTFIKFLEAVMRRILIVIDMQNDFIDGSLGTKGSGRHCRSC